MAIILYTWVTELILNIDGKVSESGEQRYINH